MTTIDFTPLFPWTALAAIAVVAVVLLAFGLIRRARGIWWRALALTALLLGLANPVLVEEDRQSRPDILTVVVDDSPSQSIGERPARTAEAVERIRKSTAGMKDLEVHVIHAGGTDETTTSGPVDGTRLFKAIDRALADVPARRSAGTIIVTDGEVHDVPDAKAAPPGIGPLHAMLTGRHDEYDRRLVIAHAPKYGIVGKQVELSIRVEDSRAGGGTVPVTLVQGNGSRRTLFVPVGHDYPLRITLDHAGPNIVQMETSAEPGELTALNNRAVVAINGVRDRLRVLLVSGEPHPGERVWRNLLKADPSVDLVHFTILRPPDKQDLTPVRELSLIAFPIRELFEVKLNQFDLIIFDRYRRRGVLPSLYIENIARYVENGGAVLEAAGPEFAGPDSLFQSPLGGILPGEPTGKVFTQPLRPRVTPTGQRFTVTADLPGAGIGEELPRWGRWFRQIDVVNRNGTVLMSGVDNRPLLIVKREGKGRVAQILSDQIWLWARGYEGGGPYSELLRRIAHWLMKEPELEENSLHAELKGNRLSIVRHSVKPDDSPVQVTAPSGKSETVQLTPGSGGRSTAAVPAKETGIYRVKDDKHTALAAVGNLNPLEYADMRTTESRLKPLSSATGGGIYWLADGMPELRRVRSGRIAAGKSWLGLVENRDYAIRSVHEVPMLPAALLLVLALGTMIVAWRAEGR